MLADICAMGKHANAGVHAWKDAHMCKCVAFIHAGGMCGVGEQGTIGHQSVSL